MRRESASRVWTVGVVWFFLRGGRGWGGRGGG